MKPTLKSGKDQQNVESYRPISNLSFLGKTIETAAKKQLIAHMETLNVLPEEQSAYSEFHSTETALCSIVSDLLEYMWCSGSMLASHARGPGFNPRAG